MARFSMLSPRQVIAWVALGMLLMTGSGTGCRRSERPRIVQAAAAFSPSFALDATGQVWSFGMLDSRESLNVDRAAIFGDCLRDEHPRPAPVQDIRHAVAISAGAYHMAALDVEGQVWVWGANDQGQLGDGTRAWRCQPRVVQGLPKIAAIAAGGYHLLALDAQGQVWAWGGNTNGQLGDGSYFPALVPKPVRGLPRVVQLAAGHELSAVLDANGRVWTWGGNRFGQIGNGKTVDQLEPLLVTLPRIARLSSGAASILATEPAGEVWGWGANYEGQLCLGFRSYAQTTPVKVPALRGFTFIVVHTFGLGVDAAGRIRSWGDSAQGELGNGIKAEGVPTLQTVHGELAGARPWGGYWRAFAVDSNGDLWGWGANGTGQLGTGEIGEHLEPVRIDF